MAKLEFHPDYLEYSPVWDTCEDAVEGQREIKKMGEKYLPRLSGQADADYKSYLQRALYFNATGRTVEAMIGLAFRKDIAITVPKTMESWLLNFDLAEKDIEMFSREVLEEFIVTGRCGILVDYPQKPEGVVVTETLATALNLRPYAKIYEADEIINWQQKTVNGVTSTILIDLLESDDKLRKLELIDGIYQQSLWQKDKNNEWNEVEGSRLTPLSNGKPLTTIPFVFVGKEGIEVYPPVIEDMVYVNLSHYQNSADLENGCHVTGLPTPYITGVEKAEDGTKLSLGTGTAWMIPNENAKVGFVQVGADGFASLEKAMDRKEQMMAALGARLVAPDRKAAETAETASIRRGGETSVLAEIIGVVNLAMNKVLNIMAVWAGVSGEIKFAINKNYMPKSIDAPTLTAWVGALQSGSISNQTFFEILQGGEVLPERLTFEEETDRKETQPLALGMIGA